MTLEHRVEALPDARRLAVALQLLRRALPLWDGHTQGQAVRYRDSVVGMEHRIAPDLLARTIDMVDRHRRAPWLLRWLSSRIVLMRLAAEFDDPLVSLQDLDMEWPEPVKLTFYAAHNLLVHSIKGGRTSNGYLLVYVSIDQVADALVRGGIMKTDELEMLVREA
jgi:hypothetical protein